MEAKTQDVESVAQRNFFDLNLAELGEELSRFGHPTFRGQQIYRWIYGLRQENFSEMTNLSKTFREELPSLFRYELPSILKEHISVDGTRKYLFDMGGGLSVESVLIPSGERLTLCVSSEVGCNMACQFCFTAKQKLKRRLSTSEILGQFIRVNDVLPEGGKITNVVFMGMGEPLDNPEAVFKSIEILNSPWGLNFSRKKITVSTSGLVPLIPRVAASGARLAVSLNAVNDDVRNAIMPINKKWPLKDLLAACSQYAQETKDRVTFEYVLLKGVTDSVEDARALHRITRNIPCKINIIPFNEHPQSGFERPSEEAIVAFHQELMRLGTHVLRRKTMGRDIYAACGQLTTAAPKKNNTTAEQGSYV